MIEKKHFGSKGVDAINHTVVRSSIEELNKTVVPNKLLYSIYLTQGIDIMETSSEKLGFGLSDSGMKSDNLAVDVAFGHYVAIDKGEGSYTGTAQLFGCIAPYPTETDHENMGGLEGIEGTASK